MNIRTITLLAGLALPLAAHAQVMNAGFEFGVATPGPTPLASPGIWGGEPHAFVGPSLGITPMAGNRMLQFRQTTLAGPGPDVRSTVSQVVNMSPWAVQIAGGGVIVSFSSWFNRAVGTLPVQSDSMFTVRILSFSSATNALNLSSPTLTSTASFLSDANPFTWQNLGTKITLPITTTHIAVQLEAEENVFNNLTGPEFSGHFADNAGFQVMPAPGAAVLLGLGGLMMSRRRR